jgi:putative membrane protein
MLGHLEEIAKDAPRPMHLIVLSDHGQSQGATFKQRYGESLSDLVHALLPTESKMTSILESEEASAHFEAMLTEGTQHDTRSAKVTSRLLKSRTQDGVVSLHGDTRDQAVSEAEVVVLASGNLGLISFTGWPVRMSRQEIDSAFPTLLDGLREHPGIGLVLLRDEERGGVVFGPQGAYWLESDTVDGENPLEPYGEYAAHHLRRTDSFPACPDIMVISTYWPNSKEVAAFEELVGSHGGLGGPQRDPFVLHPAELELGEERIIGAGALNAALRRWIAGAHQEMMAPVQAAREPASLPAEVSRDSDPAR